MKKSVVLFLLLVSFVGFSQETINAMFYNVFRFPSSSPANREYILRDILDEFQPDLFMICELENEMGADLILNTSLENQPDYFDRAEFHYSPSEESDLLQNMVFYNTRKFTLLNQEVLPTPYRDINRYSFQLNTIESLSDPIFVEVFISHLKSSTGTANQQIRLSMVEVFTQALEEITHPNTYVLFAGDFNFYTASEPGYQKILSPDNAVIMVDPINAPGSWHDHHNFKHTHTQSTRLSNAGFGGGIYAGASGGLDDRFDFIMMSENFNSMTDLFYVGGTYKAFGNNGNCLNKSINDPECEGEFSLDLRDKLYWMSDHTPVVMQFQTSHSFLSESVYEKKSLLWFESANQTTNFLDIGVNVQEISPETKYLCVYNLMGQEVHRLAIENKSNIRLDVSGFSSGVYFIKAAHNQEPLKFIKK